MSQTYIGVALEIMERWIARFLIALRSCVDLGRLAVLGQKGMCRWMLRRLSVAEVLDERRCFLLSRSGAIHYFEKENGYLVTGFDEADQILRNDILFKKIRQTPLDPYEHFIYAHGDRHSRTSALIRACLAKEILYDSSRWVADLSVRVFESLPAGEKFDWHRRYCMPTVFYSTCHILGFEHGESDTFFRRGDGNVESSDFYVGFKEWCLQSLKTGHVEGDSRMLNTFRRYVNDGYFTADEASELLLRMFAGALKTTSSFLAVISRALMDRWSGIEPSDLLDEQVLMRYVEESLRLNPIVPRIVRQVVSDTSVSGVPMRKGAHVFIDARATNKDQKRFEKPESASFSFGHPRHLTFGAGIHHCIGMHMARHQMKVVLPTLIERIGLVRHITSEWTIETGEHHFYHPRFFICKRSKIR